MKKSLRIGFLALLIALVLICTVGCVPDSAVEAKYRMEAAGYEVDIDYNSYGEEGVEALVYAWDDDGSELRAALFESPSAAKKGVAKIIIEGGSVKRKGRWVYSGSYKAIKIFED